MLNEKNLQKYKKTRKEFELLKLTRAFKKWRKLQRLRQGDRCFYEPLKDKIKWARDCKGSLIGLGPYHVDHIKAIWHKGTNDYENLVLACSNCNQNKRAKIITIKWLNICGAVFNIEIIKFNKKNRLKEQIAQSKKKDWQPRTGDVNWGGRYSESSFLPLCTNE